MVFVIILIFASVAYLVSDHWRHKATTSEPKPVVRQSLAPTKTTRRKCSVCDAECWWECKSCRGTGKVNRPIYTSRDGKLTGVIAAEGERNCNAYGCNNGHITCRECDGLGYYE